MLDCCRIAQNKEEFVKQLGAALLEPGRSAARSDAVRDQSWEDAAGGDRRTSFDGECQIRIRPPRRRQSSIGSVMRSRVAHAPPR